MAAVRLYLEHAGFEVMSAADGRQAPAVASSEPPPDLLVLDLMLPGFRLRYPKVMAVHDRRYVDNGKFVTTAGISSGIMSGRWVAGRPDDLWAVSQTSRDRRESRPPPARRLARTSP